MDVNARYLSEQERQIDSRHDARDFIIFLSAVTGKPEVKKQKTNIIFVSSRTFNSIEFTKNPLPVHVF